MLSSSQIDVHYSLPRDDHKGPDRDRNQVEYHVHTLPGILSNRTPQGTLIVSLRNSASGQLIDDNEVRRKFQQFGDVKSVTSGERSDERLVEFYDMRVSHRPLLAPEF